MDDKRFDDLVEDNDPVSQLDANELISFTKQLHEENRRLKKHLDQFNQDNPGLKRILLTKLNRWSDEGIFWGLPLAVSIGLLQFVFLGWIALMIVQHGPTGNYILQAHSDRQGACTQIYREVNWAADEQASECFTDTTDALVMLQILQGGQDEQESESGRTGETTEGEAGQEGSGAGPVPEVSGHGTEYEVKEGHEAGSGPAQEDQPGP